MRIKKILLVRPPRYLWPFINESDNFLLPLGLPQVAASVRTILGVEVKIIDCPPLKIGWKSLKTIIENEKPDMVGAGEEALYHHEAVRLFSMCKEINQEIVTVGGGHFFSWMPDYSLQQCFIDYVVRFEGEETFVDLIETLNKGNSLENVKGIAFYNAEKKVIKTPNRPLISDLDSLPIPAYDLMPMGKYAPFGYLWPVSATIEHSRGCVDNCKFCSLWTFWGKQNQNDAQEKQIDVRPFYRTKSVERTLEEVDILYNKYDRRYLIWADPTFNVDLKWNDEFCEGLLKRNYKDLHWWAFLRADYTLRDEQAGVLEKMVKAGLVHPLIGIERSCDADLKVVNKTGYSRELTKEVFSIFKEKYPQVFRQGTFVTCLPDDDKDSMNELVKFAVDIDIDYPAFHPLAPVPGTYMYADYKDKGLLNHTDFSKYDWATPVVNSTKGLKTDDLCYLNIELNKKYVLYRPHWLIRGIFSRYKHKRNLYWWFLINTLKMLVLGIRDALFSKNKYEGITGFMRLKKPFWYDE